MTASRLELKFATGECDVLRGMATLLGASPTFGEEYAPRSVHSLYFDTRALSSYSDHAEGLGQRAKVRLRWYGALGATAGEGESSLALPGDAALEIKRRQARLTSKLVFPLRPGAVGAGNLEELAHAAHVPLAERLNLRFEELEPTALVSYDRHYFVSAAGVRCTLDSSLRVTRLQGRIEPVATLTPIDGVLAELKAAPDKAEAASAVASLMGWLLIKNSKYMIAIDRG